MSNSRSGAFCVFLIKPCKSTIHPSWTRKKTRDIRPSERLLLIFQSPFWALIERHRGMPTGQPNSAVRISSPMDFRSFDESDSGHSRIGARPVSDSKNRADNRLYSFMKKCTILTYISPIAVVQSSTMNSSLDPGFFRAPQIRCDSQWINGMLIPPHFLVTDPVKGIVMDGAKWHDILIADLA